MVKQHGLIRDDNPPQKLKALDNFKIWMYQHHNMVLQVQNKHGYQAIMVVSIIDVNFTGCDLILGIPWLQAAKSTIK